MKVIDDSGKFIGNFQYNDGRDIRNGDYIKFDKVYYVLKRVWEASIGEITTLIVREVTAREFYDE